MPSRIAGHCQLGVAKVVSRTHVIWLGAPPPHGFVEALETRRLSVVQSDEPSDDALATSCAAIFNIPKYNGTIAGMIKSEVPRCISHGARPIIRADSHIIRIIQGLIKDYSGRWHPIATSRQPDDLAEEARDEKDKCGPSYEKELDIQGCAVDGEDRLLFQRAFHDCTAIELLSQKEGKSNAKVFRVHARVGNGAPGSFMLPFLAKLDSVSDIKAEFDRFERYVVGHVPFSQRPNIAGGRSVLGANRGILVGDFVEDATSLARICERPEARSIIYSIFDDALRSWRRHAYVDPPNAALAFTNPALMPDIIRPAEILPEIVATAKKRFGLRATPQDLVDRLTKASVFKYQRGIVHGDLHPGNVMVRGTEAILIDFFTGVPPPRLTSATVASPWADSPDPIVAGVRIRMEIAR